LSGDQASSLRNIAEEQRLLSHAHSGPRRCRAITVTGGKGGVGKTAVAVNIALALQTMGRRTLLLDADISLANADVMLHMSPAAGLHNVLRGESDLASAVAQGPLGLSLPGRRPAGFASLGALQIVYLLGEPRPERSRRDGGDARRHRQLSAQLLPSQRQAGDHSQPTAMLDAFGLPRALAPNLRLAGSIVVNMARNEAEVPS
jgi:flagellar biosynthesis protein FlhG